MGWLIKKNNDPRVEKNSNLSILTPFQKAVMGAAEHHFNHSNLNSKDEKERRILQRARDDFPNLINVLENEIPKMAEGHKKLSGLNRGDGYVHLELERVYYENYELGFSLYMGKDEIGIGQKMDVKGEMYNGYYEKEGLLEYKGCPEADVINYIADLTGYYIAQKLEPEQRQYLAKQNPRLPGNNR